MTRKEKTEEILLRGNLEEIRSLFHPCACVGCQEGEELCPCKMNEKEVREGISMFALNRGRLVRLKKP